MLVGYASTLTNWYLLKKILKKIAFGFVFVAMFAQEERAAFSVCTTTKKKSLTWGWDFVGNES